MTYLDTGGFRLEDILTDIVSTNFEHVHPDVLATFVPFLTAAVTANPVDAAVLLSNDYDALQDILADFQSPSGDYKAKGIVVLYWPPGPDPPPPFDPASESQRPAKKQRVSKLRDRHPFQPFGEVLDPGSGSINTMMNMLPDYSDLFWLDIYTRRQPIIDSVTRQRLTGSKPFDHDPTVPLHLMHAMIQIEAAVAAGHAGFVLLCGRAVEEAFVARFGAYKHGKKKLIAGREVRIRARDFDTKVLTPRRYPCGR